MFCFIFVVLAFLGVISFASLRVSGVSVVSSAVNQWQTSFILADCTKDWHLRPAVFQAQ
jgi:hypothetical protein